ncbi:MAG TPA: chorismate synthase, partial [Hyphomonas sp.]|nr:chorismate synthase [Hyphomonas sp.]
RGAVVQIGPHMIDPENWNWDETQNNPFWCPDAKMAAEWETFLDATRKAGSSAGAIVEVHASGVPAGWGAPVYGKLDAELAGAMMSINA